MITDQNIKPERQAYVIGAEILKVLTSQAGKDVNPFSLYEDLREQISVSYYEFSMGMNWLYLLGAFDLKEGGIIRCS